MTIMLATVKYRKNFLEGPLKGITLNPETVITSFPERFTEGKIIKSLVTGHAFQMLDITIAKGNENDESE